MDLSFPHIELPELFWSFETGAPMTQCSMCGRELLDGATDYMIEKGFKDEETLFEVALCMECHARCALELSEESRENIQHYFQTTVRFAERFQHHASHHGADFLPWVSHCMAKGYPMHECGEYQLYGYARGDRLLFNGAPYLLSGEAIEEIFLLCSHHTRGILEDLTNRLLDLDAPKEILIL